MRCVVVGEVTFRNSIELFGLYALYVANVLLPEGWNPRQIGGGITERLAALRREPSASAANGFRSSRANNNNNNVLDDIAEENENSDREEGVDDAEVGLLVEEDNNEDEKKVMTTPAHLLLRFHRKRLSTVNLAMKITITTKRMRMMTGPSYITPGNADGGKVDSTTRKTVSLFGSSVGSHSRP